MNTRESTWKFGIALAVALLAPASAWAQDEAGSIVGWGSQVVGGDLSEGFVGVAAGGGRGKEEPLGAVIELRYRGLRGASGFSAGFGCGDETVKLLEVPDLAGHFSACAVADDGGVAVDQFSCGEAVAHGFLASWVTAGAFDEPVVVLVE